MTEKEIRLVEESVPLAGYVAKRWVKQAGIEWEDGPVGSGVWACQGGNEL